MIERRHNMPSRPINFYNDTSPPRLDRRVRQKIGHELRSMYNDFREWELPQRLRDLLARVRIMDPRSHGG